MKVKNNRQNLVKILIICSAFLSSVVYSNNDTNPFSLKFTIKYLNYQTGSEELYRNGFVYITTIQKNNEYSPNLFLRTNHMGRTELTLPFNASNNVITVYKVNKFTSSVILGCKLGIVDGESTNSLELPLSQGKLEYTYELVLKGQC